MGTGIRDHKVILILAYCACFFLAGTVLQFVVGNIPSIMFRYPWSVVSLLLYLYVLVLLYFQLRKKAFGEFLWSNISGVISILFLVPMLLVMGLTGKPLYLSWPFLFLLLHFISVMGLRCLHEFISSRKYLKPSRWVHLMTFLLLSCAVFSYGDKRKVRLMTPLNTWVDKGLLPKEDHVFTLPFSLCLKKFEVEEYLPKLYLFDAGNEKFLSQSLSVDTLRPSLSLSAYKVKINQFLDCAIPDPDNNSFRTLQHVGAFPAAYVTVSGEGGREFAGWLGAGSFLFQPTMLPLSDSIYLCMKPAEARRYVSHLLVEDKEGKRHETQIEVNRPFRLGSWMIYQQSYDVERGKWSTMSILQCVYDPWYPVLLVLLWGLMLSVLWTLINPFLKR